MGFNIVLGQLQVRGEGYALLPFGFQINGVTNPDNLQGVITSVVRAAAGKFTCQINPEFGTPVSCLQGDVDLSVTTDATDFTQRVDWSTVATNGQFTVRTLTGAVLTDPADNTFVGGFLLVKLTDRVP